MGKQKCTSPGATQPLAPNVQSQDVTGLVTDEGLGEGRLHPPPAPLRQLRRLRWTLWPRRPPPAEDRSWQTGGFDLIFVWSYLTRHLRRTLFKYEKFLISEGPHFNGNLPVTSFCKLEQNSEHVSLFWADCRLTKQIFDHPTI